MVTISADRRAAPGRTPGDAPSSKAPRSAFPPRLSAPYAAAPRPSAKGAPYPFLRLAPDPMPLDMPTQDLGRVPEAGVARPAAMPGPRWMVMAGALLIALVSAGLTMDVLRSGGFSAPEWLVIVLSFLLSGWIGFGFVTAAAGFVTLLAQRGAPAGTAADDEASGERTAILMPIYNEDPAQVLSAVQAIAEDLARIGARNHYDLYLLSDTRDEAIARAEAAGVIRLKARLTDGAAVYYRRRPLNTDRKAGNIADWVRTFGGGYAYMLILDADSLMSAETIVGLTAAMDRDPRLGLLQTVPGIINAETPFARLQQFANRLYGPIFAVGQAWWSGAEGNYWGHNAILRVKAFAESAGLPHLPGRKPFGGHILSHDFVEAALLRRRGWAVRMTSGLSGSYEETPPTLLDMAMRDRRWCQGNLQHARLLDAAGLHWVSRLHLLRGVLTYLAPMLWLVFLAGGALVWPGEILTGAAARREVLVLFGLTVALLMAPKLMACGLALLDPATRRGFGGARRMAAGFLLESALSTLTAPVTMVMQTVAVVEVLLGRDSGWAAQRREGGELTRREAWRAHRTHVALGVAGAAAALVLDRYFLIWTSPVFIGLSLSALLSLHSSRATARRAGQRSVLQTPEEVEVPAIVRRAAELRALYAAEAALRRRLDMLFRTNVPPYGAHAEPLLAATPRAARRLAIAA